MAKGNRRQAVLDVCLKTFIQKGPSETTVRDLSKAMGLQPAGVLYWYPSKDEVVVACAEEAAKRLERELFMPTYVELLSGDPHAAIRKLHDRADEMAPYARFFTSVCNIKKYNEHTEVLLGKLFARFKESITRVAVAIGCPFEEIAPCLYQLVSATTNYMLFSGSEYIDIQMEKIKKDISLITQKYSLLDELDNITF